MMKKILFEDALILNSSKLAGGIVCLLPLGVSLGIGRGIGSLIYCFSKRRRIARKNLRAAFAAEMSPEKMDQIALSSFQNMAMAMIELLSFPRVDEGYIRRNVRVVGAEKYEPYLGKGKGIIFLTGHFGNWELLNITGSLLGHPVVALARRQKHRRSDDFLNSLRSSKGAQVILKGMPVRQLIKALDQSKIVGILSDQDGGRHGAMVRFFGRLSSTPRGAATFALRTHAPVFPTFIFREGVFRHRIEVEGPLEIPAGGRPPEEAEREMLQEFACILEKKIRKSPAQWLWAHRRWKSTPDRSVLILSDEKAGHLNQSLAFLEGIRQARKESPLGDLSGFLHAQVVKVRYKNNFLKNVLKIAAHLFGRHIPFRRRALKMTLKKSCYKEMMSHYADLVVSCGTGLGAVNLMIAAENAAKSAVLMKPFQALRHFDAVIAPKHDKIKPAGNIFLTESTPTTITPDLMRSEALSLERELGGPRLTEGARIGFLVGGDTDKIKFNQDHFRKILNQLLRYSSEQGAVLLATSSRRTPSWAEDILKEALSDPSRCPLLVIAKESNRAGVVTGILGLSDAVVVSGESVSMVSEAIASGKPVVVFMPSEQAALKAKNRSFLDGMQGLGLITLAGPDNIYEMVKRCASFSKSQGDPVFQKDRQTLVQAAKELLS